MLAISLLNAYVKCISSLLLLHSHNSAYHIHGNLYILFSDDLDISVIIFLSVSLLFMNVSAMASY